MDDFTLGNLQDSRNEWCCRLINILAPLILEGFISIFTEAFKLCEDNQEVGKYLMTFQNMLSRVPKWNTSIIEKEVNRIIEKSGCGYLADLVTCVHIIQLKSLTCMRVGSKQKKVDIDVPSLNDFIHKTYINCARKLYSNVYLFERGIPPLSVQKNNRELDLIIKECILDSIRDSIPIDQILKTYMDETIEDHTEINYKEEIVSQEPVNIPDDSSISTTNVTQPPIQEQQTPPTTKKTNDAFPKTQLAESMPPSLTQTTSIKFEDMDHAIDSNNTEHIIHAPKTDERLEQISNERYLQRKKQEENEELATIQIGEEVQLDVLDVHSLDNNSIKNLNNELPDLEIEVLS